MLMPTKFSVIKNAVNQLNVGLLIEASSSRYPYCRGKTDHRCVRRFCSEKMSRPIKVLNVAEKNDAAKNIAGLISHGSAQRVSTCLQPSTSV